MLAGQPTNFRMSDSDLLALGFAPAVVGTVPGHSDNEVWVPADRDTVGEVGWYTDDYYLDSPVPFWYGPNGKEVGKEETNADQWIH